MPPFTRARPGLAVLTAFLLVACTGPGPAPFQEPVPGSVSTTDWVAEEPPMFGAAAERSPDEIVDDLVQQEIGSLPGAEVTRQLTTEQDGTMTAYLRATLPPSDHPLRGRDTRARLARLDGTWEVTSLEIRYHCATEEPSTDFCQ